ncbi:MAG: ABC transporter substrate-binding protein, partial [bacterium]|nr:ABC transporter substrate-binding protein [bacterium]
YRLRDREGLWKVIDVKIEGISLISSFRSQFKEVLSQNGPDEVLRRLKEKTASMQGSGA